MPVHPSNAIQENLAPEQHIGLVDPKTLIMEQKQESEADRRRREARENLPPVGVILNLDDFERVAKDILSDQAWAYYSSAGDDEVTLRENRNSFGRVFFKPRVLRKVSEVNTSLKIVGGRVESALPIYISPAAMAKLGHPDGELNLTRGAAATGLVQGVSVCVCTLRLQLARALLKTDLKLPTLPFSPFRSPPTLQSRSRRCSTLEVHWTSVSSSSPTRHIDQTC